MQFTSTRGQKQLISAAQAILRGIADDGGLFVPNKIPTLTLKQIADMSELSYAERAEWIIGQFLTDYTTKELAHCVNSAYSSANFPDGVAPLVSIDNTTGVLELWHGKTSAFKDVALQILPYLLTTAAHKLNFAQKIVILVATSGDTGKAALEGFTDVKDTQIVVFYPVDGVSDIQKLQMATQVGNNVHVFAVEGNFDDAQSGVKSIFTDKAINQELQAMGYQLSSANSINWGRLVPQIVYYFSAYVDLLAKGLELGEKVNFCVPTGNFGNILAGYYAKLMGLPVNKFVCASNANNVLTDFINTGVYDKNRSFHQTTSPSMDILISSNLERFLYIISQGNAELVAQKMQELSTSGVYQVPTELLSCVKEAMSGYYFDDAATTECIAQVYKEKKYLLDPHTAVAYLAAEAYRKDSGDNTYMVILSTASPFKFSQAVLNALELDYNQLDSFAQNELLAQHTTWAIPTKIKELRNLPVLHKQVIAKNQMYKSVKQALE